MGASWGASCGLLGRFLGLSWPPFVAPEASSASKSKAKSPFDANLSSPLERTHARDDATPRFVRAADVLATQHARVVCVDVFAKSVDAEPGRPCVGHRVDHVVGVLVASERGKSGLVLAAEATLGAPAALRAAYARDDNIWKCPVGANDRRRRQRKGPRATAPPTWEDSSHSLGWSVDQTWPGWPLEVRIWPGRPLEEVEVAAA